MDSIQEIIFSILGIGVYWFLSNLGKKKKNENNNNINDNNIVPPKSNPFYEEGSKPNVSNNETQQPQSFSDLLNILSDPSKISDKQRQINPLDPERSERKLEDDLKRYSPTNVADDSYESEMKRYYDDQDDYQWKDDFSSDKIDEVKVEKGKKISKRKKSKKKPQKISTLFRNPDRVRDAFIMNEILSKKHE